VQTWLGQELEKCGIDAMIYTRYVLSLLLHDSYDYDLQEQVFACFKCLVKIDEHICNVYIFTLQNRASQHMVCTLVAYWLQDGKTALECKSAMSLSTFEFSYMLCFIDVFYIDYILAL
jgi:hypothetical protein